MAVAQEPATAPVSATTQPHQKAIWTPLEAIIERGYQPHDVFHDWLNLMVYAMQRRDPDYLKTIRRYPNDREPGQREADYFSHALGALMIALNSDVQDYLGLLYEEHISTGHLSQIFTPQSLSQMISAIALEPQESPFTVCDPACGSHRRQGWAGSPQRSAGRWRRPIAPA